MIVVILIRLIVLVVESIDQSLQIAIAILIIIKISNNVCSAHFNVRHVFKTFVKYVREIANFHQFVYALAIITIVDNQIVHNVLLNVFNAIILAIIVLNVLEIDKCHNVLVVLVIMMMKLILYVNNVLHNVYLAKKLTDKYNVISVVI